MARYVFRALIGVCAVASLGAAAVPASSAPEAAHTHGHGGRTVLLDCFQRPQVRPEAYMLACGDGNSRLVSLKWSRWGADGARGSGVNVANDCVPYCAAGTFHSYPVRVRLDGARPWAQHSGVRRYTQLTLTFTGDRPDKAPRSVTYPLGPLNQPAAA